MLLFVRQCLLVVGDVGSVLAQWISISELVVVYDAILRFMVDLDIHIFLSNGTTALNGPGPLLLRRHDHTLLYTPHLVGLLWTSDQPDTETGT
jgi:hypothetical protein